MPQRYADDRAGDATPPEGQHEQGSIHHSRQGEAMILLGIDPGVQGALALLDRTENRVTVHDMPDTTATLFDLLGTFPKVASCMIEKPFYPKIIGVKNVAKIAEAYGRIKTALFARGIPLREVAPKDWKAALNLSDSKAASRELAGAFFPDDAEQWKLAKHDGRAEAALLAWYSLRFAQ